MKRLACAILRAGGPDPAEGVEPGGPALARIEADGLAIAYALVRPEEAAPTLDRLAWYASAIEAMHRRQPTLPLRFGCVRQTDAELVALLAAGRDAWLAALEAVDGCEEMGLRVMLEAAPTVAGRPPAAPGPKPRTGAEYLAGLRARLDLRDASRRAAEREAERMRAAFEGLFRDCRVDAATPGREAMASIAFLVPRGQVEAFRAAFRAHQSPGAARWLLTGPWPPYSFVVPPPDPRP